MTFADLLADYSRRFPRHGVFELRPGESMRARCRAAAVPNSPGVYLIDGRTGGAWVLCYIGKAGTLRQDGSFRDQGLFGRLNAVQHDMPRQQFYERQMAEQNLDALRFHWFETFGGDTAILPAKAEADLLQVYFDTYRCLPPWNAGI